MQKELTRLQEAANYIRKESAGFQAEIALVMGSGMGMLAEEVQDACIIPYQDIPNFPVSTVRGHAGKLFLGQLNNRKVMLMQGRAHFYEGHTMRDVVFPIRVMQQLGVTQLMLTNAAGGVNPDFIPGDLMLIKDHINFAFNNPLIGAYIREFGDQFVDTSQSYTPRLQALAREVALSQKISLKEGVYQFMTGPSFETPAEIRMARYLGADAIGMSTFPEALVAAQARMEILGISYISNQAAGISPHQLSHQEVFDTMEKIKKTFIQLVCSIVAKM